MSIPTTKTARQARILDLVTGGDVHSQAELAELLAADGIQVTQATLSRDLDELGEVRADHAAAEYLDEHREVHSGDDVGVVTLRGESRRGVVGAATEEVHEEEVLVAGRPLDGGGVLGEQIVRALRGVEGDSDQVLLRTGDHGGRGYQPLRQAPVGGDDHGNHAHSFW